MNEVTTQSLNKSKPTFYTNKLQSQTSATTPLLLFQFPHHSAPLIIYTPLHASTPPVSRSFRYGKSLIKCSPGSFESAVRVAREKISQTEWIINEPNEPSVPDNGSGSGRATNPESMGHRGCPYRAVAKLANTECRTDHLRVLLCCVCACICVCARLFTAFFKRVYCFAFLAAGIFMREAFRQTSKSISALQLSLHCCVQMSTISNDCPPPLPPPTGRARFCAGFRGASSPTVP